MKIKKSDRWFGYRKMTGTRKGRGRTRVKVTTLVTLFGIRFSFAKQFKI